MSAPGVIEAMFVQDWLHDRLDADATLRGLLAVPVGETRISPAPAPASWGRGPFVVADPFTPQRDVRGVGLTRISSEGLWIVKAIMGTASYDPLIPIAERIDTLLGGTGPETVGARTILACHREEAVHYPESDGAVEWRHLGGLYRIRAQ